MKTKLSLYVLLFCMLAIFNGCKKEGPQGPEGPQGIPGPTAQTDTYNVNFYVDGVSYRTDITNTNITQAIVNDGAVLTYMSNGAGGWSALPLTYFPSTTYSRTFEAIHYLNGLTVWNYDSDGTLPVNPGAVTLKVVVISGSKISNWPDTVDTKDYNQVIEYLRLKD